MRDPIEVQRCKQLEDQIYSELEAAILAELEELCNEVLSEVEDLCQYVQQPLHKGG